MKINYTAQIRTAAGRSEDHLPLSAPITLAQALQQIATRYGDPMRRLLLDASNQPHPTLLLFLNDRQIRPDQSPLLNDNDTLSILSPISGG